jgi:hypothetical protein
MMQRDRIECGVGIGGLQQCRQAGGEAQPAVAALVVQRLDAQAITHQVRTSRLLLPQAEGEHAVEPMHAVGSPCVPGLEDDLGVAVRKKMITERLQFRAQLGVVVDAAVEDDGQSELRIMHGLVGGIGQIDDLQAPMSEGQLAACEQAVAVRAARRHGVAHGRDQGDVRSAAVKGDFACDTLHDSAGCPPSCRAGRGWRLGVAVGPPGSGCAWQQRVLLQEFTTLPWLVADWSDERLSLSLGGLTPPGL